eukprot:scaffold18312_cov28-Phaeocystis_antarctica.AAC.1
MLRPPSVHDALNLMTDSSATWGVALSRRPSRCFRTEPGATGTRLGRPRTEVARATRCTDRRACTMRST